MLLTFVSSSSIFDSRLDFNVSKHEALKLHDSSTLLFASSGTLTEPCFDPLDDRGSQSKDLLASAICVSSWLLGVCPYWHVKCLHDGRTSERQCSYYNML